MDILPSTSPPLDFGNNRVPHGFQTSLLLQFQQQLPPILNPAAPNSLSPNILMDQSADEPEAADEHKPAAADKYTASLSMLHREIFSDIKGLLQPLTGSVSSLSSCLQSIKAQLGHGPAPALPASAYASTPASASAADSEVPRYNLATAASASSSYQPISFRRHSISSHLRRLIIQCSPVPPTDALHCSLPYPSPGVTSTNPGLNSSLSSLLSSAWQYMSVALAPSTISSYSTAWSAFSRFCAQNQISPTSFNQNWILAVIVYLRDILHLSPSSIKSLVSFHQRFLPKYALLRRSVQSWWVAPFPSRSAAAALRESGPLSLQSLMGSSVPKSQSGGFYLCVFGSWDAGPAFGNKVLHHREQDCYSSSLTPFKYLGTLRAVMKRQGSVTFGKLLST
ncbi:UNVERIFIED_CONTAM: hypothetical protein FKN15_068334 [Acipenser sinensis]